MYFLNQTLRTIEQQAIKKVYNYSITPYLILSHIIVWTDAGQL